MMKRPHLSLPILVCLWLVGAVDPTHAQERYLCEVYCSTDSHAENGACASCGLPLRPESFFRHKLRIGKTVAILLFPGVQVIDFSGPFEVLGAAGARLHTVAKDAGPLRTDEGLVVVPEYTLANCPPVDLLVLPGGKVYGDSETADWIRERAGETEMVLSVCNGLAWLEEAGLLDGLEVTTTATALARMLGRPTGLRLCTDRRVVGSDRILTSGGYTCGIDGALEVVSRWKGPGAAKLLAVKLEYDWQPDRGAYSRYRPYYVHLRTMLRRLEVCSALEGATMTEAEVDPDLARVVWQLSATESTEESLDELRALLRGMAGPETSTSVGGYTFAWTLEPTADTAWTARCEILAPDAEGIVRVHLRVEADSMSAAEEG